VGNYQVQTAAAEPAYLSMPGTNLFRGYVWGSFLFTLTLAGIAIAITRLRRLQAIERRNVILVLIAMSAQVLSLIWLVPLPWQRYVIALVPYVCVWIAYCLDSFIQVKKR
jgi:Ca2+/Na+ antiporter